MDQPLNLLGYVRVSGDDQQRFGHSVHQQPERLRAYCAAFGHTLVDIIAEPTEVSAGVPLAKRKGGAELLRRLRDPDIDGVLVIRLERIFRDMIDGLLFFERTARKYGISVHSMAEQIDTSTAAGRLALKVHLLMADADRDRISERTAEVMRGLRDAGKVYGSVPYGCVAEGGEWCEDRSRFVRQNLARHPDTWPLREIVVALAKDRSLAQVAEELHQRGIPSPQGAAYWSKTSISRVVESHGDLEHLPVATQPHEAPVSQQLRDLRAPEPATDKEYDVSSVMLEGAP